MAQQTTKLEIKARKFKSKTLEGLNQEQEEATRHGDGPLLIVAGAGTGKTTVITRRIGYLIEQGVKPEEILALAFGEKAALEMEERVDQLLPYGYYNLQISTFHSFGEKVLREQGLEIGLPDFKVLDEVGQWLLIRNNLEKFDLDYYRPLGNPTRFIKALVSHFSRAKDELISPREYLEYAEKMKLDNDHDPSSPSGSLPSAGEAIKEVANAYHVYQKLLLDNNFLDFGDLINYCLELFQKRPRVLDHYRDKFKYILIDEFQDTNYAQYELVKLLASPKNNVTVVGDDDQSIFKFRGASISNILHFKQDYKNAKFISLTRNYRNGQKILDQAYEFIKQNNPDRLEVRLELPKKLKSQNRDPGSIEQHLLETYLDEADFVTGKILELASANPELTLNDFAILARSHEALVPFISKLEERNISYIYFANKGLYSKPIILDLISYFKLLDNYHESNSLYRILKFPIFNINHKAVIELGHFAKKKTMSLYEALKAAAGIKGIESSDLEGMRKVLSFLDKHSELARRKSMAEVYVQVFNDLGLGELLVEDYQSQKYIAAFNKKIQQFQPESDDKSLRSFMNQLSFELEAGDLGELEFDVEAGPEAVKLMSVHAAKGLEFTYVFVAGLVDKRFPTIERREQIEIPSELIKDILPEGDIHLEEERRLFYVAMTRAKKSLILTRAHDYGGRLTKKPSRFLIELGLAEAEVSKPTGRTILVPERSRRPLRQAQGTSNLPIPKYFSFSQVSLFRSCPLEYKARYILGIPVAGTAQFSFGRTIHSTFEGFLKLYKQSQTRADLFGPSTRLRNGQAGSGSTTMLPPFKQLVKFYEEAWIDEWFDSKAQMEEYRELGKKMLKLFYEEIKESKPSPQYLEEAFKLRLEGSYVVGKIDRADEGKDGLTIIDYKTGRDRGINKVDREQLLIYQWAVQEFFKDRVERLEYWFLADGLVKKPFLGNTQDIAELKQSFAMTIKEIVESTEHDNFYNLDMRISHDCKYRQLET